MEFHSRLLFIRTVKEKSVPGKDGRVPLRPFVRHRTLNPIFGLTPATEKDLDLDWSPYEMSSFPTDTTFRVEFIVIEGKYITNFTQSAKCTCLSKLGVLSGHSVYDNNRSKNLLL